MYIVANVVGVLGKKRAIELMHETEMIDAQGGMMTNVSMMIQVFNNGSIIKNKKMFNNS